MRRALPLLLLPALLLASCAEPGGNNPGEGPADSYAPDDVVVRAEYVGGFVPVEYLVTRLPRVSVYGDGRVITQGPVPAIHPGPALPNVLVQRISAAGVDELVRLAISAGVGHGDDFGSPLVADAASTRLAVLTDDGPRETTVYALELDDQTLTPGQRASRQRLQQFVEKLTDLPATLGATEVLEPKPYVPVALAVLSRPAADPASDPQPAIAWPGPALPGEPLGGGPVDLMCLNVTGPDVTAVLDAAAWPTNAQAPWEWDGQRYTLLFRPLLPDESSCADLGE
jgi:hypothetical protein